MFHANDFEFTFFYNARLVFNIAEHFIRKQVKIFLQKVLDGGVIVPYRDEATAEQWVVKREHTSFIMLLEQLSWFSCDFLPTVTASQHERETRDTDAERTEHRAGRLLLRRRRERHALLSLPPRGGPTIYRHRPSRLCICYTLYQWRLVHKNCKAAKFPKLTKPILLSLFR